MEKKVLIVEDSKLFLALLEKNIKRMEGFTPYLAKTYEEAQDLLRENEFYAAILDMVLPDAPNGEIVDLVTSKNIPSIVQTANDSQAFREKIAGKYLVDYVIKKGLSDVNYATSLVERISKNREIKVLIVDDSKLARIAVVRAIFQHQFVIYEAQDGEEALEILEEHPDVKIVFTDYHMPKMDGFEFVKNARKKFSKESMAIIVISSESDGDTSSRFIKNGANDYIKKPFTKEEFVGRMYQNLEIIELIEKTNTLNANLIEINHYNHDEQTRAYAKQKGIITNDLEGDAHWQADILYKSSDIMCGDLYSIHKKEDGSLFLYLLDGMGHGIQPSLTVFAATTILKQSVNVVASLEELLEKLLESLRGILAEDEQLSYSIFHISPDRKKVNYINGGMYPTYIRSNDEIITLKANSLPIMPWTPSLQPASVEVEHFRSLIVYSDGVIEEEFDSFDGDFKKLLFDDEAMKNIMHEVQSKKTEDDTTIVRLTYLE